MKNPIIIAISVLALVASFLVFTNTSYLAKGYSNLKGGAGEFAGPTLSLIAKPVKLVRYVCDTYFDLIGTKKENSQLKKEA